MKKEFIMPSMAVNYFACEAVGTAETMPVAASMVPTQTNVQSLEQRFFDQAEGAAKVIAYDIMTY